jgi:hypothetical protein
MINLSVLYSLINGKGLAYARESKKTDGSIIYNKNKSLHLNIT